MKVKKNSATKYKIKNRKIAKVADGRFHNLGQMNSKAEG